MRKGTYHIYNSRTPTHPRNYFLNYAFLSRLLALIYFGWDKFWTWYEKPIKQEWAEGEYKVDDEEKAKPEVKPEEELKPESSAKPISKTKCKRIKNYLLNNKIKTLCLLGIIICLIKWGLNLYRA